MTDFIFQFHKTLQAAAYILQASGGRMNYANLLRLLYIADRECLAEEGDTITGDTVTGTFFKCFVSYALMLLLRVSTTGGSNTGGHCFPRI